MNDIERKVRDRQREIYLDSILNICQRKLFELIYAEMHKDMRTLQETLLLKVKGVTIAALSMRSDIPEHLSSNDITEEAAEHLSRIILNILLVNAEGRGQAQRAGIETEVKRIENGL